MIHPPHGTQTLWYFNIQAREISRCVISLGPWTAKKKEKLLTWYFPSTQNTNFVIFLYISSKGFHICQKPGFYGRQKRIIPYLKFTTSRNTNFVISSYISSRGFQPGQKLGFYARQKGIIPYLNYPTSWITNFVIYLYVRSRVFKTCQKPGFYRGQKRIIPYPNTHPHGTQTLWYLSISAREVSTLVRSMGSTDLKK